MSRNFKVACVGAGYFSRFHYEAWHRLADATLVGSADKDLEKAEATGLTAFTCVDVMLAQIKPDILDIITPPPTHLDTIKAAIEAGVKVVICQKPFCQDLDEARTAVALADAANITLIVHENFRFQPWYREMHRQIESGVLGHVQQLTFRLRTGDGQGPDAYLDRQPYFQKMPRFLVHETGVHLIDTFRYLLGDISSVYASLCTLNSAIAGEDAGYILTEHSSGARACFDGNRHLDHASENTRITFGEALLEGTKGTITLTGDGALELRKFGRQSGQNILPAQDYAGFAGDCVYALQNHIITSLQDGNSPENLARDYLRVLEIEEAVYTSSAEERKLHIQ